MDVLKYMTSSSKILPQDDICACYKRVGDHTDYEMWVCLQKFGQFVRNLLSSLEKGIIDTKYTKSKKVIF